MATLTFDYDEQNERIIYLNEDGKRRGAVWQPGWSNEWFWSLHGEERSITTGADKTKEGACTDIVAAYWKHIDKNAAFPAN
ncbi:hypothetical protein [Oricola thermophila]|uniref:Uncharacterized protein n=1 Tax=Oricola thermophila TaxID=2742145 RepID=A0A6N1VA63_9HYPH|nr:hypothetical protein [Oricola thermophila]QKV17830.1 hypothetical protein HTY61_04835 [Oricola thermophila]